MSSPARAHVAWVQEKGASSVLIPWLLPDEGQNDATWSCMWKVGS